jgi:hypothetical protein
VLSLRDGVYEKSKETQNLTANLAMMSPTMLVLVLAVGMGIYGVLARLLGNKQDPREPPLVSATIPYIGHVIGMMRKPLSYYVELRYELV